MVLEPCLWYEKGQLIFKMEVKATADYKDSLQPVLSGCVWPSNRDSEDVRAPQRFQTETQEPSSCPRLQELQDLALCGG
jgi:hypothetical protein